jgi:hypothetical protein
MWFIDANDQLYGCFGSPTQLDVLTLEAHMLAPSDEVVRKEIRTTTGIEYVNRNRDLLPSDFFRDLSKIFADAKPMRMVRDDSHDPFVGGIIAGVILHNAVGGISVSYAVSELSRRFGYGYSRATIHNLWRDFKAVSHYWAAYVSAGLSGAPDFPCTVDSLAHFVATADAFRKFGQVNRAWKSKEAILPGDCLRLDCRFELPILACPPQIFVFSKSL